MSNLVLDRMKRQTESNLQTAKIDNVFNSIVNTYKPIPLSPFELQSSLEQLFPNKQEVIIEPKQEDLSFPDLFHFCEWYLNNKDGFSPKQQTALNTLVQCRDLINVGCGCKRQERLTAALNYFKIFWENNIKNDLIPTMLAISKASKVVFGNFLQFP